MRYIWTVTLCNAHSVSCLDTPATANSGAYDEFPSPKSDPKSNVRISFSFPKFGVPTPVTASQPCVALNPGVPHPGLLPVVMSLNASGATAWMAYTSGLRKPSEAGPRRGAPS